MSRRKIKSEPSPKVTFRLTTDSQKKKLDEVAARLKKLNPKATQSDALRYLLEDYTPEEVTELKNITVELKRIGNNLNQLTKAVHQGRVNCSYELEGVKGELKKIWLYLSQHHQKLNQKK